MAHIWSRKADVVDTAFNYGPGREGGIGLSLNSIHRKKKFGYVGFGNPFLDPDPDLRRNPRGALDPTTTPLGIYYVADIMQYDPETDKWKALWIGDNVGNGVGDFKGKIGPCGRQYPYCFGISHYIYVGSGFNVVFEGWLKDLWRFDTHLLTWEQMPDPPADFRKRHKATGFSMDNKGYIGLGAVEEDDTTTTFLQDFWEFDPSSPHHGGN